MTLVLIIGIIIYIVKNKRNNENVFLENDQIIDVNYKKIVYKQINLHTPPFI
ncbi:MAG: hypothetical protein KH369_15530 [Paraclostridium bifermentans]|uniref:hypothetical protein n=1 Tax=Paraclostridium bifermentans TaxID=1490 RepID=UPI001651DC84|nr:hypothetical protein [Paraclostridium bifermentans]MBS6509611.1 hypothetical protein [Paraclostridium bifermentans]MDU3804101.1 hypothetical protein [Paraclostridium bifermentans]